jgi:hypothetical protein
VGEEPLTGGRNASEVVRVGDTVRRAKEPGSASAARLLGYLEASGFPYAPRYLGGAVQRDFSGRDAGRLHRLDVLPLRSGPAP